MKWGVKVLAHSLILTIKKSFVLMVMFNPMPSLFWRQTIGILFAGCQPSPIVNIAVDYYID